MTYHVPPDRRRACRWRNLTFDEQTVLSNGCGGKGGWLNPPDLRFEASCDQHDFNYWTGGSDADRLKADRQFYVAMLKDANTASWATRWLARLAAWSYFKAVRLFGDKHFHHGNRVTPWIDVEVEMEKAGYES